MIDLRQGDCLEVMKSIPDGSVDLILTDPPYGTTKCKWDSVIPLDLMWQELKRITKPRAAIVMTAAQPFTSRLISSNYDMFRYNWVYRKPQGVDPFMAKRRPLNDIEDVVVFCGDTPPYNPQLSKGEPYTVTRDKKTRYNHIQTTNYSETTTVNKGTRLPKRVLDFKQERGLHPTQKPVALMEYLIKTYTNEDETVLDFTMGSGSTGVACVNTNRKFIGIELDPDYFKIAETRINEAAENSGFLLPKF